MIVYSTEKIDQCLTAILPLLSDHAAEVDLSHKTDPDVDLYRMMEKYGVLQIVTAREDGELLGYCIVMVARAPQRKNVIEAQGDMYYIAPHARKGWVGVRLLRHSIELLQAKGVKTFRFFTSNEFDTGPILRYLGFEQTGAIYTMDTDNAPRLCRHS